MDRFIGIDTHSASCTFVVLGPSGKRLAEQVVETNAGAIRKFIGAVHGQRYICFEEGTHSAWLYEILEPLAQRVVVAQPRQRQGMKNDSRDALALAEALRTGAIRNPIYKAPGQFSMLRQAVRGYDVVLRDMVRAKNRLRAVYRSRGLDPGSKIYDPAERAPWLEQLPAAARRLAALLSAELDALTAQHEAAEAWLLAETRRVKEVRLLCSAPGIGPIRASQIVARVVTPYRFRQKQQFWSYCGLAVVTRSSSDWLRNAQGQWERRPIVQTRGLNRNRQPMLKAVFKGAALSVIIAGTPQPLYQDYQRLLQSGVKPNLARLTLARRIAAAVLAMWKNKEAYRPEKHCRVPAAT